MKNIVSVKNVSFGYDGEAVLKDISFSINKGDYLGIVGPNGSGKSTLLKLMLGILSPVKGTVELFGKDIGSFRDWGSIGYVPQKANSFNTSFPATVEEVVGANLFSKIGLFKSIKGEHRDSIYKALDVVGMREYGKRLIGNLSGGQQQRVFIARALVSSPEVIFLDEPTVGIDIESQQEFFKLLDRLNSEMDITIVMVSHDIGVITKKASRVACMGDKRVIMHNNHSDIKQGGIINQLYGEDMKLLVHRH